MLVVGATYPKEMKEIRKIAGDMTFLVPGIGAQGGDLKAVMKAGLNNKGLGLIINSSRGIIFSDSPKEEAEKLCDRVGIIKEGELLKIENIDEFREKNIREIHIDTSSVLPLSTLKQEGVTKIERTTTGYHLITTGKNGKILQSLAKFDIEDIKVSEPSLEEIFMHYYKK